MTAVLVIALVLVVAVAAFALGLIWGGSFVYLRLQPERQAVNAIGEIQAVAAAAVALQAAAPEPGTAASAAAVTDRPPLHAVAPALVKDVP